ncbi:MAG: hypothetical protein ACK4R7_00870 [Fervidobacterium sp.]
MELNIGITKVPDILIPKTLKNILNFFIITFSFISINNNPNLHLYVAIIIAFIFVISLEKIISAIMMAFGILYILTFLDADLKMLFVFGLLFIIKNKKINKIVKTILYFSAISIFNYSLTFIFAIAFLILNFIDDINTVTGEGKSHFLLFVAMLVIILSFPMPDLTLKFRLFNSGYQGLSDTYSSEENLKKSTNNLETYGLINSQDNSKKEIIEPKIDEKNLQFSWGTIIESFIKINQKIIIFIIASLLLLVIVLTSGLERENFKKLISNSAVVIILTIFLASSALQFGFKYLTNKMAQVIDKNNEVISKDDGVVDMNFQNYGNHADVTKKYKNSNDKELNDSRAKVIDIITFSFQIISISSSIIVALVLVRRLASLIVQLSKTEEIEKKEDSIKEQNKQFSTDYSYEKILMLSGKDLIEHAYLYIRKTFYPAHDNLTPYELLELESSKFHQNYFEPLTFLTERFVKLKYALETFNFEDKELSDTSNAVKEAFVNICISINGIKEARKKEENEQNIEDKC